MSRPFRQELKYVVHHSTAAMLIARWSRHLAPDPHTDGLGYTPVLSQYYDTGDLAFYREKIDGLYFRNKVRLRTYGTRLCEGVPAYLEIKQRLDDRVRKIRRRIDALEPGDLDAANWKFEDPRDASAFGSLLARHPLFPSAQVFYSRKAFSSVVEPSVRVTFDTGLRALHPGTRVDRGASSDGASKLMSDTLAILEVKSTEALPRWVIEGVVAAELFQQPVPKYVAAVERLGPDLLMSRGPARARI